MVPGIMSALDTGRRTWWGLPENRRSGVVKGDGRAHGAQWCSPRGTSAQVLNAPGQRAVARSQPGL